MIFILDRPVLSFRNKGIAIVFRFILSRNIKLKPYFSIAENLQFRFVRTSIHHPAIVSLELIKICRKKKKLIMF